MTGEGHDRQHSHMIGTGPCMTGESHDKAIMHDWHRPWYSRNQFWIIGTSQKIPTLKVWSSQHAGLQGLTLIATLTFLFLCPLKTHRHCDWNLSQETDHSYTLPIPPVQSKVSLLTITQKVAEQGQSQTWWWWCGWQWRWWEWRLLQMTERHSHKHHWPCGCLSWCCHCLLSC